MKKLCRLIVLIFLSLGAIHVADQFGLMACIALSFVVYTADYYSEGVSL